MRKFTLLTVFGVVVACVAPPPTFAQRAGHGGGGAGFHTGMAGGFHVAGGGRYGYAGGRSYGGYHGAGYYGGHGSYGWHSSFGWRWGSNGWHGGYWGYPRYGWGWGFGFGFGWPYWNWGWGYPYGYGYSPWYYAPYPYYCPTGYACPSNQNDDPPAANPSPKSGSNPAKPWTPPAGTPSEDHSTSNVVTVRSRAPLLSIDKINLTAASYRVAHATTQPNPSLRPELQRAMRALREMPPFAREREIETGRYRHFSYEERELLRNVN